MKYAIIILLSLLLLSTDIIGRGITEGKKYYSLTITLDNSFTIDFFDSTSLSCNGVIVKTQLEYDKVNRSFYCYWPSLPKGKYEFRLLTVFGGKESLVFTLTRDKSVVIPNKHGLLNSGNLEMARFKSADSVRIYYKSSGCFHNFKNRVTLVKTDGENYHLTYSYDSTTYQPVGRMKKVVDVTVYRHKIVNAVVIDSLVQLVNESRVQLDKVAKNGYGCMSTTHQCLYVLINGSLFQFRDTGICDWELYADFKKEFFGEFAYYQ